MYAHKHMHMCSCSITNGRYLLLKGNSSKCQGGVNINLGKKGEEMRMSLLQLRSCK